MQGSTGKQAEDLTLRYLTQNGLKLLQRNYHCRHGEIDLVMMDGNNLVFVEVRYRKSQTFGLSSETVNFRKQQKLIKSAQHYLLSNPRASRLAARFDVVGISGQLEQAEVSWIKNAFET